MAAHTWCRLKITSNLLKNGLNFAPTNLSHIRNRHRGLRRNFLRVLTPEEEHQKLAKLKGKSQLTMLSLNNNNIAPVKMFQHARETAFSKPEELKTEEIVVSQNLTFKHIKDSSDYRLGPPITKTKSRKQREKYREILLEGTRLIKDALEAGAVLKTLFFSKLDAVEGLPLSEVDIPIYKVPHHFMKLWSDMTTPPGVMGIFKMPNQGEISLERTDVIPLTLVCDRIQDPGNLGTIIRGAAAAGCERILLTKGCVDIWETKVLRSGAGSHFRIPLLSNLEWDTVIGYFQPDSNVYLADVGHVTSDRSIHLNHQMSEKVLQDTTTINQNKNYPVESQKFYNYETSRNISKYVSVDIDVQDEDKRSLKSLTRFPIPSHIYHKVNYTGPSSVLIIGNEATGPSAKAKKAVHDHYGISVMVPMAANVDSLNNSVAAAIIMFEIRRQLLTKSVKT